MRLFRSVRIEVQAFLEGNRTNLALVAKLADSLRDIVDSATVFSLLSRMAWDSGEHHVGEPSAGTSSMDADADADKRLYV